MKKYILGMGLVLSSGFMAAQAESAYVEQAASVFTGIPLGQIGIGIEFPLPSSLGLPVDTALEADLYGINLFNDARAFGATIGVKALILPSLINEPAVALAIRADANINFGGGTFGSIQVGPLITADFTPLTLSAGIYPAFANGGIGINYSLGARYYLDSSSNNALELSVASSGSLTTFKLGFRYAF